MKFALLKENTLIALNAIRSHMLRAIITILIIAFGIMALISILTAIDSIKYALTSSFTNMGANTFTITNVQVQPQMGGPGKRIEFKEISWNQANEFKSMYSFPAYVSVFTNASQTATLKYLGSETNPNISVIGGDDDYLKCSGNDLVNGRNFSKIEIDKGRNVVIIGDEIKERLFKGNEEAVGKKISIGPVRFMVVGVLKPKGSGFGFSGDNSCIIPVSTARRFFSPDFYRINVMPVDPKLLDMAIWEAKSTFRAVRRLRTTDENNFDIRKSDNMVNMLIENTRYVTLAATLIGLITLFGASIGLMNIMLVSVSERTREIGIRKAVGATKKAIRNQFLIESIVIGQLGGLLGIILGILIGNILGYVMGSSFIVPWGWIVLGVTLCLGVGLLSGLLPARRASNLDPIDALRYE